VTKTVNEIKMHTSIQKRTNSEKGKKAQEENIKKNTD